MLKNSACVLLGNQIYNRSGVIYTPRHDILEIFLIFSTALFSHKWNKTWHVVQKTLSKSYLTCCQKVSGT